jgi:hypothetical protein
MNALQEQQNNDLKTENIKMQAEQATADSMLEMESCKCNKVADNSANNRCATASVLSFAAEQLNCLNETLFFARLAFVVYKSDILSQHSSRLFRPPIARILTL